MNTEKNAKNYIFLLSGTNLNQETMGYIKGYQAYKNKEIKYKNPDPEAFRDTYNIRSYLKIIQDFQNGSLSITLILGTLIWILKCIFFLENL